MKRPMARCLPEMEERRDGPMNRAFVAAYRHEIGAADESRPESGGDAVPLG